MIAGVVAAFQSYAVLKLGRYLAPREMRTILISTGIPQGTGTTGHIGPLPNLRAAIHWVDSLHTTEIVPRNIKNETIRRGLWYSNGILHYNVTGYAGAGYHVTLSLFDLKGSVAAILINEQKIPGQYMVSLLSANRTATLNPGIYLCSMKAAGSTNAVKIVIR